MAVIDGPDLAAYLRLDDTSDAHAAYIAELVHDLIEEKWVDPVDPAPVSIRLMALNVGARGYHATPGRGHLESVTRSFDDSSKTERFALPSADPTGLAVYLTDAELALLNGATSRKRVGSMRLRVPGFDCA